jgi:hypothetical protein
MITNDYTWDDHLRMTKETLVSGTEYYDYEYCLCGAVKRHKYTYEDSLENSQTLTWTLTTDLAARKTKEYYPYAIAMHGEDEYRSVIYDYDRASRRARFSDPTFGHLAADTSGWTGHLEPHDEDEWKFFEPQLFRYTASGALQATGRVGGREIMSGEGEPYFVDRDNLGRVSRVIYPDATGKDKPQIELRYEYGPVS